MAYDDPGGRAALADEAVLAYAVQFLVDGQGWRFDEAVVELAQRCGTERHRGVVQTVTTSVRAAVTRAWERGWQPCDIHRIAVRRCTPTQQLVLVDAMSEELARYAPSTVDPRWHAQLSAVDGRVWWAPHQSWLQARRQRGTDWLTVLTDAVTVLGAVQMLPTIERLIPLPGQATPQTSERQAPVEGRILERVRMMLGKAESTTFAAEAETFTAAAQTLMARHSIDAALLARTSADGTSAPGTGPQGRRIGIDTPYDGPKATLLDAVARANRCRMVWSRDLGFATVLGYEADLEAVELLFTSLLIQANARLMAEGKRADHYGRSRTRSFRQSFLMAYAARIGERLEHAMAAEVAAADERARGAGHALVPVLAARTEQVDSAMSAMFPRVRTRSVGSVRDAEGWHVGREAADRAHLGGGQARGRLTRGS